MLPILLFVASVAFIVIATNTWKMHPFFALILAALGVGFLSGHDILAVEKVVRDGFGGILAYIGLVILFGTVIGTLLEKTGAAHRLAQGIADTIGRRFPLLALSLIGFVVAIPVFCDSGYVILNSLKQAFARRKGLGTVSASVALATGLYATHTLVPPTPGPIAAAGNLGLGDHLGLVIGIGLLVAIPAMLAGFWWARVCEKMYPGPGESTNGQAAPALPPRPAYFESALPILLPILLIAAGSVAAYPSQPLGSGAGMLLLRVLGQPTIALLFGLATCLLLLRHVFEAPLAKWIQEGLLASANILIITGAGGAFGAVLKATEIGTVLGEALSPLHLGVLVPFLLAAALKTAQGSSTVALVTASALLAPLLASLGLDSVTGKVLTVMAIGGGAMTVSHANDSFFWVVSQFSEMQVSTAYRSFSAATLVQGITTLLVVWLLSLVLL